MASLADRSSHHAVPAGIGPDWSVVEVAALRLWHGRSGPADELRQVVSPGCALLVLGHCPRSNDELLNIARLVGLGDPAALASVGGSCVVIAVRQDEVVVAGDLAGQRVVFHARTSDGTLVIGSHASQLASLVDGSLSREWLAARLLVPNASDVWWTGSPWQEVRALRSGCFLLVARVGQPVTRPLAVLPKPEGDCSQAGDLLERALHQAVASRVSAATRPTVDLSGGWDSSTVAVLAGRTSAASVSAITLVVPGVDDVTTATAIADHVRGLEHLLWIVPREVVPYSDLTAVPFLDEPAAHAANASRATWWLRGIAEAGSDLHLSGDGGDGVVMALPSYLGDLARACRLGEFWRHVTGWAELRHESPYSLAQAGFALRRTSYRDALRSTASRLVTGDPGPRGWSGLVTWLGHSKITEWMTPDARGLVAQRLRHHAEEHAEPIVPGSFGIGDSSSWLALTAFGRSQRLDADLAATLGVNYQTPYLDDEVVRACWSVPAWVRTTPQQTKPLLVRAASHLVPPQLAERQTKGDYSAVAYQGIQRNAHVLREMFTGSHLGALGLVDEAAVKVSIEQGAAGLPVHLGALDMLVSTEAWLRGWEAQRRNGLDGRDSTRVRAH